MAYPRIPRADAKFLTIEIEDISTAGQSYIAPGFDGKIVQITSVINGTIATANAVLTPKISGTAVTGGAITVAYSGSAAGDVDSSTPTAANTFSSTDNIEIETNGASTNTVKCFLVIEVVPGS